MSLSQREREGEKAKKDPYGERAKITLRSCGNRLFVFLSWRCLVCNIVCLCACMHACMSWLGLFVLFFCQLRWRISYFVSLLAGEVARAERMRIAHTYHVSETLLGERAKSDLDDAQQIRRTRWRQPVRL